MATAVSCQHNKYFTDYLIPFIRSNELSELFDKKLNIKNGINGKNEIKLKKCQMKIRGRKNHSEKLTTECLHFEWHEHSTNGWSSILTVHPNV